jgi:hypothetical protein
MTPRRFLFAALASVVVLALLAAWASPFPGMILWLAVEEIYPAAISWDGKTAWKRCDSAIAGQTSWPQSPQAACAAMHLCVNEAPLSDQQKQSLLRAILETPGCPEP